MKKLKKLITVLLAAVMVMGICCTPASADYRFGIEVYPALEGPASADSIIVGFFGSFTGDSASALSAINQLRWEACNEGNIPNPGNPSVMLQPEDYSPIEWSTELERIARTRAAESIVTMNHARLNGLDIWSVVSNGVRSSGEVLAWTFFYNNSMTQSVQSWAMEKADWVAQTPGAVTGHYTQMIDPKNKYVGLACFDTCGAGEFSYREDVGSTAMLPGADEIFQEVDVLLDALEIQMSYEDTDISEDVKHVFMTGSLDGWRCPVLSPIVYESDNEEVVQMDGDLMHIVGPGSVGVNAYYNGELLYTGTLELGEDDVPAQGADSAKKTGWVEENGNWYYYSADGVMQTGWVNDGGWYYMNEDGTMSTGWIFDGVNWYYMNDWGVMSTGWVNDGSDWYYMNEWGIMQTGWIFDGYDWYYMNSWGTMATGWVNDGGIWYYIYGSGTMAAGCSLEIDGVVYEFAASGAWIG